VDGLQGTRALAVSPDGANVYVGGFTDNALATFRVVPVGGGCAVRPASGCRTTVSRRKASLVVRDKRADAKDLVFWKWSNGADTTRADFGDPTNATSYFLCVYSGTPSPGLVFRAEAPAGPGWKSTRGGALSYASKSGDPDGLRRIVLKPGSAGHAKIVVKGKGAALALPVLPLALPAKVQLVAANGQCWEADYSRPRVNAAARFAAKSD